MFCKESGDFSSVDSVEISGNTLKRLATVLEINYKQSHIYPLHK